MIYLLLSRNRFDLTLECIRSFYANETSPLSDTLKRYSTFFSLFQDFKGYVDFFLLQDLVTEDYLSIKFYLPFNGFNNKPLPNNVDEYQSYKNNVINFIKRYGYFCINGPLQLQNKDLENNPSLNAFNSTNKTDESNDKTTIKR